MTGRRLVPRPVPRPSPRPGALRVASGLLLCLFVVAVPVRAETDFSQLEIVVFELATVGELPDVGAQDQPLADILSRSLRLEFENAGFDVVEGQLSAGAPLDLAAERGADLAVLGFAGYTDERFVVSVRAHEVTTRAVVGAAVGFARSDLAVFNLTRRLYSDLAPGLERVAARISGGGVLDVAGGEAVSSPVVLTSPDDGMEVWLGGSVRAGKIANGRLQLPYIPFEPGQNVYLRKRKPGYYPDSEAIVVSEGDAVVSLEPLRPKTRFAATVTYTTGQMLGGGVGLRAYLRPDWSFVAAETYGYVQSVAPGRVTPLYHQDFKVTVGRYFAFPRTSRFRFGAHTGIGTTITFRSGADTGTYRDPYLELLGVWAELNFPEVAFFVSPAARWSLGGSAGLLPRGLISSGAVEPFVSIGTIVKWLR